MTTSIFNKKLNRIDHTVPLFSPRSTYNLIRQNDENLLSDLTLNFDPFTINVLKNEFYIRNWEMHIVDFILVVKEHLLSWQIDISNREQKLIRCLMQLFYEIDLNGNGVLEWDEFTNFIIEKATVLNNIKTKQDEIKSYTLSATKLLSANKLPVKFTSLITKVLYVPDIDRVAFYQEGSDEIFFMNHETGILNSKGLKIIPKPLSVELSSVKKDQDGTIRIEKKEAVIDRKTIILDVDYIKDKKYQVLLTSSNDGFVRGWRYTSNGFVLAKQPNNLNENLEHYFKHDIYCMEWDGVNEFLYCGQKDGQINIWNLKTDTESSLDRDSHTKVIMDMIAMPKLQFLASAALDGNLILWDTINNKKKRVYKEHKRGIVSLAFNESLILLFSGGFDHDICVWNPYIENYIYKITGHSSPLIGIIVIENTSQVISLDSEGSLKIWDIKKFNCVQGFSVEISDEKHKFNPQSFCYIPKPLKLAVAGRSISLFDYDKNYNPNFVDDNVALCCKFVPSSLSFFTPHGNKVKIWNALTGDIKKIYSDIIKSEITAFALDGFCKRMIIGDSSGETAVFNVINGAKIKNLPKHGAEVMKILNIQDHEMFVTASMDNTIKISDDKKLNESDLIRTIHLTDFMITYLSYEPQNKLIISGTHNGLLAFWEIETGKLNGQPYHEEKDEEITSINIIENTNYIIISNAVGQISIVALPPLLFKYTNIHKYNNLDNDGKTIIGIIAMTLCNKNQKIYVLDEKGLLKCFNIKEIITTLQQQKNKKTRDSVLTASFLSPPKFQDSDFQLEYCVKTHNEQVKSLEYIADENLLITTAYDRKVKLWDSTNGKYIDSFQQNYDKKDPRAIAYKRIGTNEVYNTNFQDRIDKAYVSHQTLLNSVGKNPDNIKSVKESIVLEGKKNKEKEVSSPTIGKIQDIGLQNNEIVEKKRKNSLYIKTSDEEFNPFFDYKNIEQEKIIGMKSNEWKFYLNFENYFQDFEEQIKKVTKELKEKEVLIQEKLKKEGVYRRFNINNFQEGDMPSFDQKKLFEEEESNLKKELETEKQKKANMKKIVEYNKNAHNNESTNLKIKKTVPSSENKEKDKDSKIDKIEKDIKINKDEVKAKETNYNKLYKQELKGKLLEKQTDIKLSKEECDAAYKLAAALSNYDKDDYRILKFLDIKEKDSEIVVFKQERKNYLELNKQKITEFMNEVKKIKEKKVKN